MALVSYDFYLDCGADWIRIVRVRDPNTGLLVAMDSAVMEIRNANNVLALRLDAPSGRCLIDPEDGASIDLHISPEDSLTYLSTGNYPGAVQAVGYWGISRSYLYDLFVQYATGTQDRIMRGFFYVDPNVTQVPSPTPNALTIGRRGAS
jgi:hypothetical protein